MAALRWASSLAFFWRATSAGSVFLTTLVILRRLLDGGPETGSAAFFAVVFADVVAFGSLLTALAEEDAAAERDGKLVSRICAS